MPATLLTRTGSSNPQPLNLAGMAASASPLISGSPQTEPFLPFLVDFAGAVGWAETALARSDGRGLGAVEGMAPMIWVAGDWAAAAAIRPGGRGFGTGIFGAAGWLAGASTAGAASAGAASVPGRGWGRIEVLGPSAKPALAVRIVRARAKALICVRFLVVACCGQSRGRLYLVRLR